MRSEEIMVTWRYSEKKSPVSHTLHSPSGALQIGDKRKRDPDPPAHGGKGRKDRCGGGMPHPRATACWELDNSLQQTAFGFPYFPLWSF